MDKFWSNYPNIERFSFFSLTHWIAIITIVVLIISIILIFRRLKNKKANRIFEISVASLIVIFEILTIVWIARFQTFQLRYHLPLHLSDTSYILTAVLLFQKKKSYLLYELLFFVGLGGSIQAVITPIVGKYNFPHFNFFSFFTLHGILIAIPLYFTFVKKYRPTWKSVGRFILITNLFMIFVGFVNWVIQYLPPYKMGNYMFLTSPPPSGSIIDPIAKIFGPSPGYIVGLELLGISMAVLIYSPFAIMDLIKKKKEKSSTDTCPEPVEGNTDTHQSP